MTRNHQVPRDYQVAELTRGGPVLPLPGMQQRHLKVIAEFLAAAWNGLLESQAQILLTHNEAEQNALMEARLNAIRDEKPEWSMLVTGVSRGRESLSFDGSHLEKRPDLSIHLTGRPFKYPLIVECKLIDKEAEKRIRLYCNDGLARFIAGDYAWYAREAFMLAYVRDISTIAQCLTPYLADSSSKSPDPFLTEQLPEPICLLSLDLSQSRHKREFSGDPMAIWHLWLPCRA